MRRVAGSGRVAIKASAPGGRDRWARLDTGSTGTVALAPNDPWIARAWIPSEQDGYQSGYLGHPFIARSGALPSLRVGRARFSGIPLSISDGHSSSSPLIGIQLLHRFEAVVFDWQHELLWLIDSTDALDHVLAGSGWTYIPMWRPRGFDTPPHGPDRSFASMAELREWIAEQALPIAVLSLPVWRTQGGENVALDPDGELPPGGVRMAPDQPPPGRVWVRARLGGQTRPALLDTGASDVFLSETRDRDYLARVSQRLVAHRWWEGRVLFRGSLREPIHVGPLALGGLAATVPSEGALNTDILPGVIDGPWMLIGAEPLSRYPIIFDFASNRVGFWTGQPAGLHEVLVGIEQQFRGAHADE